MQFRRPNLEQLVSAVLRPGETVTNIVIGRRLPPTWEIVLTGYLFADTGYVIVAGTSDRLDILAFLRSFQSQRGQGG